VSVLSPDAFPIQPCSLADLRGGSREVNAAIIRHVLCGKERGPKRDAVLLNAAAALFIAGAARNLRSGWEVAAEVIDSEGWEGKWAGGGEGGGSEAGGGGLRWAPPASPMGRSALHSGAQRTARPTIGTQISRNLVPECNRGWFGYHFANTRQNSLKTRFSQM